MILQIQKLFFFNFSRRLVRYRTLDLGTGQRPVTGCCDHFNVVRIPQKARNISTSCGDIDFSLMSVSRELVWLVRMPNQNRLHKSITTFSPSAVRNAGFSCQLTMVWQADTAEDGGSRQVWLARVVVWQGMRAPGRRVDLCRRSTRLGAPGAAPSHPVLAVRPSCGLLKCNTVVFVSHRYTGVTATRIQLLHYQFTVTTELWPH